MKKQFIVLTAVSLLLITVAFAQKSEDKLVDFRIRAGVNFQKLYGEEFSGDKSKNDFKVGFHAGVDADLYIAESFYLQPGLLYTTKGAQKQDNDTKVKVNISYIELPVNLLFKHETGNGKLLLGAGPYIAYGITGKSTAKTGSNSLSTDAKFKNTISAADYLNGNFYFVRPLDFGANILAGYEFSSGISFQLNGQLGLAKINPKIEGVTSVNKTDLKNIGFGASLGYRF